MAKLTLADRLAARSARSAYARAQQLMKEGLSGRAFNLFVVAADAGMIEAMSEVGQRYLNGEGVLRNATEAGRWFLRAAERGHLPSQCQLASLHLFGLQEATLQAGGQSLFVQVDSPKADYAAATTWARKAAEAGSTDGQAMLGFILSSGPDHLRDEALAEQWYGKAAAGGSPQAQLGLGLIRLRRADTAAETVAAVALIQQAADANLPTAHYYLGLIYEKAVGVIADPAKAVEHYRLAALAGVRNGQAKYGLMLYEGNGIKADTTEGESWLRRAGLAGDWEASALIADIYARGGALPPNYAEAALWFRRAAAAGACTAQEEARLAKMADISVTKAVQQG